MVKCVFCGKNESPFKGTNYIKNDGSVNYFCSGKCQNNSLKLGRDKRKVKWTEAYQLKKQGISETAIIETSEEKSEVKSKVAKK